MTGIAETQASDRLDTVTPVDAVAEEPAHVPDDRHLARSLVRFGVTQALSWLAGAVVLVGLPRLLGDTSLGILGFATSITAMGGLVADLGVSSFIVKEVARSPARAGTLLVNALAVSVPLTAAFAVLIVAAVAIGRHDPTSRAVVVVLGVTMVLAAAGRTTAAVLQGLHRMRTLAVSPMLAGWAYAAGVTAGMVTRAGVVWVAGAAVLSNTVGAAVNAAEIARRVRGWSRPRWSVCRSLIAGGLPFFVGQAALVVYGQIDMVLLSFFSADAVIGWYAAALRIVSAAQFLPAMLITVIYPMLSAAHARPERFNAVVQHGFRVVLLGTLPLAVGLALLADRTVHLLRYPSGFEHSIVPLALLAAGMPMIALDMVIAVALGAADRQRQWAIMGIAAAIINVLLNLVAIPVTQASFHNGAIGAAAVTTLTELFLLLTGLRLLPHGVVDGATLIGALRCLAASGVMAAVVLPLREAPLTLTVAAGAVTIVAASLALRAVSPQEFRTVLGHLPRRRHHGPSPDGAP